jgi:hypothetical protein
MKVLTWSLFTTVVFFLSGNIRTYAQVDSLINLYGELFPQEKIHVHFDKPAYNTGETIWFKAYLYSGIVPSGISKNFYAELVDPSSGKILQQKIVPIFEASASGSFDLPENLNIPSVVFRAYTTWMLNFDSSFLYTKTFRILNKTAAAGSTPQAAATRSLKLFPEGGDLVVGLESVVAFKSVDYYGLPVEVKGTVKDNTGAVVTTFESEHDGMGKFKITPKAGATYYAEWQDDKKQVHKTPLPAAKKSGVVLSVLPHENTHSFIVRRPNDAPENLKTLWVIASFNQQVVYKARLNLGQTFMIGGHIPLDGIPTGILQITVFDLQWNALAERIAFINKEDYFFTTRVTPVLKDTRKRGKNVIEIEVPDTLRSNMSIAITDAALTKQDPDAENIVSRLLLSGDLKGYVHNPYYYFLGTDSTIRNHLDLVMMTHGWRRYKWEDLAAGKLPEIKYFPENYLSLNAELAGVAANQIPKNTELNVFLEAKDSSRQILSLAVDSMGRFREEGLIFFDTVKVYYSFNNNKFLATRGAMNFTNGTWRGGTTLRPDSVWRIPLPVDTSMLNRGKYFAAEAARIKPELERKVKTLEAVTVSARGRTRINELDENYTSGLFRGSDAYSFDMVNDPFANSALNIFQYLQGKVAGLQISGATGGGIPSLSWRGASPTLFLNEMQVDVSTLQNMPVTDIAYIKVFRPPFFGAAGGGSGGAIAVYTKKGNEQPVNQASAPGLEKGILVGYAAPKEFYSPDYSQESPLHDVTDVRTTLYWSPYVLTDGGNKRVTIQFYNNDISTRLRVVLEGMNAEGRLTRVEKIIE